MSETVIPRVEDKPYIGICHECLSLKTFHTAQERDLWEKFHPHQEAW